MTLDAIILAGGKGTRLAEVVSAVPKPLAPVAGAPFLEHLVDFLEESGVVGRIVIAAGYKAAQMDAWARQTGCSILQTVVEPSPLGTGGALLYACDQARVTETVLVLNGDSLIRFDLRAMLARHRYAACGVTMAITEVPDVSRFGEVLCVGDEVVSFHEKGGRARAGWINAGIYLVDKTVLEALPRGVCSLEYDLMPRFLKAGVRAYPVEGAFVDIGTPETYASAARILGF